MLILKEEKLEITIHIRYIIHGQHDRHEILYFEVCCEDQYEFASLKWFNDTYLG